MVGLFILFLLVAVMSLGFAVWVVTRGEWHWGFRALLALTTLVLGFAPIVWLFVVLSQLSFN